MIKHKILSDIGLKEEQMMVNLCGDNDSRAKDWAEQRKEYGFDERETWSLDYAFVEWLLERLVMYKNVTIVDMSYHKFDFKGEVLTQEECIDRMIELCKKYIFTKDSWDAELPKTWYELTELWSICGQAMWW